MMANFKHHASLQNLIFVILILSFLIVRSVGLGADISNSDAFRWHKRSLNFLTALKTGELKNTYQHYQPGVTLMWANSLLKQGALSYQHKFSQEVKTLENADYYLTINFLSKLQLVLILTILFSAQLFMLRRLTTFTLAVSYGFLVVFEPYLIGIDRWFHLTSLETYFAFTSFLCILFWQKANKTKYLLLSGLLLVLGIYSKLTVIVILFINLLVILDVYKVFINPKDVKLLFNKSVLKHIFLYFVFIIFLLILLFPAVWVDASNVYFKLSDAIFNAVSTDSNFVSSNIIVNYLYYFIVLCIKLSPITLLLLIFSFVKFKQNIKSSPVYFYTFIYFAVVLFILTISSKKIDRYAISLILPIITLIAFKLKDLTRNKVLFIFAFIFSFFVYTTYIYYPVYSGYYSPLLGLNAPQTANEIGFYDNSGEYYVQAALSLNSQGRDKLVWIPYNMDTFKPYYKGNVVYDFNNNVDYAVTSLNHKDEIIKICPKIISSYGSKNSFTVVVFSCNN